MFRSLAVVSIVATLTGSTIMGESSEVGSVGPQAPPPQFTIAGATVPTTSASESDSTTTLPADPTTDEIALARSLNNALGTPGVVEFSVAGSLMTDPPLTRDFCISRAQERPLTVGDRFDRNLIAQMTHEVFECLASVEGLDDRPPTALRRWNGAAIWGFGSLAEQVAAESVVVAYCESEGFGSHALTRTNGFGYGGLFQMGTTEMRRFGEPGADRFDPTDNAVAAANYFLFQYQTGAGWGGWSPWAVVNTNFNDEVNDQVKIPVLPRFVSSDPEYQGRPGPELPAWAVDPWSWEIPEWSGTGCPYSGGRWPAAKPQERAGT
ncbi:MAG: hypothetical protein ACLGHX_08940 [Acidimicrobiia bacterium]